MLPRTARETTITSTPEAPAPKLFCPECDAPLKYHQTIYGGVPSMRERWDRVVCRVHGLFEYRHRTRKLRSA